MSRELYTPANNSWNHHPEADWQAFSENVEAQAGGTVPMSIKGTGKIVLNTDDLPAGVSENDAKQAIKDNHPYR